VSSFADTYLPFFFCECYVATPETAFALPLQRPEVARETGLNGQLHLDNLGPTVQGKLTKSRSNSAVQRIRRGATSS
jgi:hypothetical protein